MSVAPEIALLAAARAGTPGNGRPAGAPGNGPLTLGTLARRLRAIAAAPEQWWGLVRFDPSRSVEILVEDQPEYGAWLVVMAPGDAGRPCDCDAATLIAGEATEAAGAATEATEGRAGLQPGLVRVHGQRHWLRGHGTGYSISLHARTGPAGAGRRELAIQRPAGSA